MSRTAKDADVLAPIAGPEQFAEAFPVSSEVLARLEVYVATLRLWQKRINLVSPATLPDVWRRHIADSAQLVPLAPARFSTWADLGSGAGFPGLVVAILLSERQEARGMKVTLVESDQRKCAFMAEVVRQTRLDIVIPVDILCTRIESTATRGKLATVDVVSARALAPLDKLFELASPLLGASSTGLFLKGRGAEAEIEAASRTWQFSHDVVRSRTDPDARIVRTSGTVVQREG